jgi:Mn2+/Fe2+ NRAMP family transporter
VLASNLMAMLVQTLSAKLGIATGRNLAEVCRDNLPRRVSFGIPFALVPLVLFTSRRSVMGGLVNNRQTTVAAWAIAVVISSLNIFLLVETFK